MPKSLRPLLVCLFALAMFPCTVAASGQQSVTDVRILMDVSASMLRTDPANLRQPAQRLLAELLPDQGVRAGIWNFGDGVKPVIPVGTVDAAWRQRARSSAAHIHSLDQWTDIRTALETASRDWQTPDPAIRRHIVLFTDGEVDVANDPRRNAEERLRILDETLPALRRLGVTVHTIGLSDEIDHELMQELAGSTGGGYLATAHAEELQRLFLRIFDRVADRETVPLSGNRFMLDDSINEATILAFRGDTTRIRLHPPRGEAYDARRPPTGVNWRQEPQYELITIANPLSGEWRLEADEDPDNRVMVVTDLQLHVEPLPSQVLAGEQLELTAWLSAAGDRLTMGDFLTVLDVTALGTVGDQDKANAPLALDDSVFRGTLPALDSPGNWTVTVLVDGGTFQRQRRQALTVIDSPLQARMESLPTEPGLNRRLSLSTPLDDDTAHQLRITGNITTPGQAQEHGITLPTGTGRWHVDLDFLNPEEDYNLVLSVEGNLPGGRAFRLPVSEFDLPGRATDEPAAAGSQQARPGPNLLVVAVFLVLFNLALIALVAIGYLLITGRRKHSPAFDDSDDPPGAAKQPENLP